MAKRTQSSSYFSLPIRGDGTLQDPRNIQKEIDSIDEQLCELSTQNYKVYIRNFQCVHYISSQTESMLQTIDSISKSTLPIAELCTKTQKKIEPIISESEDNMNTLEHHRQILSLLEVPQLMEACVCGEMFDDALELVAFASSLQRSQMTSGKTQANPIIECIINEVQYSCTLMRNKVLENLRGNLQLPMCLKLVGILRTLDSSWMNQDRLSSEKYERKLQQEFLAAREIWLVSQFSDISTKDPYQYLVKLIERKRTTWFDMITQYQATFGNMKNGEDIYDTLLCSWSTRHISEFIHTLKCHLLLIDDFTCLANLLEQSMYFAGALGRIGADFRSTVAVCFEDKIVTLSTSRWNTALAQFQEHLQQQLSLNAGSIPLMVTKSNRPNSSRDQHVSSNTGEHERSPPRNLLSYPVLALFVNSILESFNELRRCAIVSAQIVLARRFHDCLAELVKNLNEFCLNNKICPLDFAGQYSSSSQKTSSSASLDKIPLGIQLYELSKALAKNMFPFLLDGFQAIYCGQPELSPILSEETLLRQLAECKLYVAPVVSSNRSIVES